MQVEAGSLVCSACGSASVRRSRRNLLDRLVSPIGYLPYRCRDCRTRFYWMTEPGSRSEPHRPHHRSDTRARRRTALRRELLIYTLALAAFAVLVVVLARDRD